MIYGLLGKHLSHSISPMIHNAFGNESYQLFATDDVVEFLKSKDFDGLNVTIPYKETVLEHLDELDVLASRSGSVNTIVRRSGKLIGYNTDYYGLKTLIDFYDVSVKGKRVLIIGNGGAAKTADCLFRDLEATSVIKICRTPRSDNEIPLAKMKSVLDFDIIVNTTPVGMYPDNETEWLFPLESFTNLSFVIDLVYNPLQTNLLLDAKTKGVGCANGLFMLVAQAAAAHELFFGDKITEKHLHSVYFQMHKALSNIVLIGLPSSGKSLYARKLHDIYGLKIIDTDNQIESETNLSIPDIFAKYEESYFRELEYSLIKRISKEHGLIISTGGGMVTNPKLMRLLKQNGFIVFLDKDPLDIIKHPVRNRPLVKKPSDLLGLAKLRRPLYEKYADLIFKITKDASEHFSEIEVSINEHFDH
ncbi:MAG: shikimate kinase [Bacilli bacterium]|nr:shikimate kinase [Bacilli bacterium]